MAADFSTTSTNPGRIDTDPSVAAPIAVIGQDIPSELPILPMRNIPVFPGVTAPVAVGRAGEPRRHLVAVDTSR